MLSHFGIRAISNLTDLDMVETRNQEKTMLELVEEIRAGQENQKNEFRQRIDSLDERYNKLERLVFEHASQI